MKNTCFRFAVVSILLLWSAATAVAQTFAVRGEVYDTESRTALPLFPVQLLAADSSLYAIGATDSLGRFSLAVDSAGAYKLRVTSVGFSRYEKIVSLTAAKPLANVGRVGVKITDINLGEALVTGKASNLTILKDTFVYSSKAMQLDPGVTLSAMISQMPGVSMDEDGNLVWQGKVVESLLVDGKRFFGGDIKTALQNLPAEVIEKLKFYDKKSDMTERTGVDDGERTTVMDVVVKDEYRGHWTGNLDAGGGYQDKWTGRLFLANLSKRLQVGVAGSANNLNGNLKADANGNWTSSGYRSGWSTFYNTSVNIGWTNKDEKSATGYQELNANFSFNRTDTDLRNYTRQENILPGAASVWWYQRQRNLSVSETLTGALSYSINLSKTTFLTLNGSINNSRSDTDTDLRSATFNANPALHFADDDALAHVFGPNLTDDVRSLLVNTLNKPQHSYLTGRSYSASANLSQKLGKGDMLNLSLSWDRYKGDGQQFNFYDMTYYTGQTERHEPQRQYIPQNNCSDTYGLWAYYNKKVAEKAWFYLAYGLTYYYSDAIKEYWNLELLPGWESLDRYALTALPEDYGSMAALLLDNNSNYSLFHKWRHSGYMGFNGNWEKWETSVRAYINYQHNSLDYERHEVVDTAVTVREPDYGFTGRVKYKFNNRTSLSFYCSASTSSPDIVTRLNYVDTSNPESTVMANTNLKDSWRGSSSMNFNTFLEKQQLSLWASAYYDIWRNNIGRIMRYNEETGYYIYQNVNMDGRFSVGGSAGMSMVLDREKVWTLNYGLNSYVTTDQTYLATSQQEPELNTQRKYSLGQNVGLTYRKGKLFASLTGSFSKKWNRNAMQPESNENPILFSYNLTVSYTTPWDMIISTNFEQWSRRRHLDHYLNTDQLLWNASISQKFLKKKNLTVKLEAVDILNSRENIYNYNSAIAVGMTEMNGFQRYVVGHLIYTFNLGKNK